MHIYTCYANLWQLEYEVLLFDFLLFIRSCDMYCQCAIVKSIICHKNLSKNVKQFRNVDDSICSFKIVDDVTQLNLCGCN